jgi:hypothetical protein
VVCSQDPLGVQAALTAVYDKTGGDNLLTTVSNTAATATAGPGAAGAAATAVSDAERDDEEAALARARAAFATNSTAITTCDYVDGPGATPPAQSWKFVPVAGGAAAVWISSADGKSCLSANALAGAPGIVACSSCHAALGAAGAAGAAAAGGGGGGGECEWDVGSGYSGESGHVGKVFKTVLFPPLSI